FPTVAEQLHRRDESVTFTHRPDARADQKQRQRHDQRRRRSHQSVSHNAVREGVTGRTEDSERRHVRAEKREQKDDLAERTVGQKVIFRRVFADFTSKGEDSNVDDDRQIGEDEKRWDHRRRPSSTLSGWATGRWRDGANWSSSPCPHASMPSPSSSRCEGQAPLTSNHIKAEIASV